MEQLCNWIDKSLYPRDSVNRKAGSYVLKHLFERDTGAYVTEEGFKIAMKRCGFEPLEESCGHHFYGISDKSPAFR